MSGRVVLVGAGPGDPDLLTVRAARELERALIPVLRVLFERLLNDLVPRRVEAPAQLEQVFLNHGTPLSTQSGHIGKRPDLVQMLASVGLPDGLTVSSHEVPLQGAVSIAVDGDPFGQAFLVASPFLRNTSIGNLLGLCGASVPCGFTRDGLPVGLMIYGRAFHEGTVLRVARAFQQATDWHLRAPENAELRGFPYAGRGYAAVGPDREERA